MKTPEKQALIAFGAAIRAARIKAELKQEYIANKIGVQQSYITKLEGGKATVPSPEVIDSLAKLLKLDEEELAFMLAPAAAERVPERFRQFLTITRHPEEDTTPRTRSGTRAEGRFPVYGVSACGAMIEAIVNDRLPHGEQRTTEPWLEAVTATKSKRAFAVKAEGDSMAPTILDGDEVLIDPNGKLQNGDVALVQYEGESTLKRWKVTTGIVILEPDNEAYPSKAIAQNEFDAAGGVAWPAILTRSTRKLTRKK